MARRKGFLARLGKFISKTVLGREEPKRRATTRETRQFRRGRQVDSRVAEQYAQDRRDAAETQAAKRRERDRARREKRDRAERPFREVWSDEGNRPVDFRAHYTIFNQLPLGDDLTPEEREDLWRAYVENMVTGRGYRFDSVTENPFWSFVGVDPRDFRWNEWRRAMAKQGSP